MKKTIMALAIAMFGIAFGSNCSPVVEDTGWVYEWKFTGKTTSGKKLAGGSACSAGAECAVRVPSSLKIQGYTYMCSPACGADSFECFAEALECFYMKKPWRDSLAGGVSTEISHIIGKSKKQYECGGSATFTNDAGSKYDITYAGLGKYDVKNGRVKSISGNFAGVCSEGLCDINGACGLSRTGIWSCSTLDLVCDSPTVVYGKWSCKYKKSASKKYAKHGTKAKMPKWVVEKNI